MTLKYIGSHIPNFKNSKMITRGRLITDPKKQAIMKRIINSFRQYSKMESGLCSLSTTFMVSDKRKRDLDGMLCTVMDCLTSAGIIEDDNIYVINSIKINVEFVSKGSEGVVVELLRNKSPEFHACI